MNHVHFLGGFLMPPSVWSVVFPGETQLHCTMLIHRVSSKCIHYYHDILFYLPSSEHPSSAWEVWCENFSRQLAISPCLHSKGDACFLVGYSLGARLALHHMLQNPQFWTEVTCISPHPGLLTQEEKDLRLQSDAIWAQKLHHNPWSNFWKEWNLQDALAQIPLPPLPPEPSNKKQWGRVLETLSLGLQQDLRPQLALNPTPLHWITGQDDAKFCQLADTLPQNHNRRHSVVKGAKHRVPWENTPGFLRRLSGCVYR